MVAFGPSMFCADAEPYYYDYLCGLDAGIPQAITEHIRYCAHCRAQIRQLEAAIAESEAQSPRAGGDTNLLGALSLHFAHMGEDVTCAGAKSFLPALLIPSLKIRIPTPITVHVDHCRPCAADLKAIRELELRPEQLARLSRLYASISGGDGQMCRRTRAKTWAFACASFEGIDPETLDHMCVCARCRRRVYRCREKILAGRQPGDTIAGIGLCSGISAADLFEWVVPYGRAGGSPESSLGDEAARSHLQACPECIERMQALHCTIYGIAERVDSGVATIYTVGAVRKGEEQGESPYSDYPICVEVARRRAEPVAPRLGPIARAREHLKRWVTDPRFRPAVKTVLAAAMIALVVALFINIRPASATSINGLAKAVRNVENVHITTFDGSRTTSAEEIWVARASGWMSVKNNRQDLFYDITQHALTASHLDGTSETIPLEQEDIEGVEDRVNRILTFVQTGISADQGSEALTQVSVATVRDANDVYELTGPSSFNHDLSGAWRLRIFVDPDTGLPRKAEYSRKMPDDLLWRTRTTVVYEYPSPEQMDLAKKEVLDGR